MTVTSSSGNIVNCQCSAENVSRTLMIGAGGRVAATTVEVATEAAGSGDNVQTTAGGDEVTAVEGALAVEGGIRMTVTGGATAMTSPLRIERAGGAMTGVGAVRWRAVASTVGADVGGCCFLTLGAVASIEPANTRQNSAAVRSVTVDDVEAAAARVVEVEATGAVVVVEDARRISDDGLVLTIVLAAAAVTVAVTVGMAVVVTVDG